MKKNLFQKALCLILSVTTLLSVFGFTVSADAGKRGSNRDTAATLEEMQALVGVSSYEEYLKKNGYDQTEGLVPIVIDVTDVVDGNGVIVSESSTCTDSYKENQKNWQGFTEEDKSQSLYLPATGSVTWSFTVPDGYAGYYHLKIVYYSCITDESSSSAVERKLLIDGKAPFDEVRNITLDKAWSYTNYTVEGPTDTSEADGTSTVYELRDDGYYKIYTVIENGKKTVKTYKISQDINGNSMASTLEQSPQWHTYYCQDSSGYYDGYFKFYMLNGSHQITLAAEREPVIIKSIELVPYVPEETEIPSYSSVKESYESNGYKPATGNVTVIEAEFPDFVSDASVSPSNDNTSSATYPVSSSAQLYNVIGETGYNAVGQWAAYTFRVDADGLYKMSMRYLQDTLEGMYICRAIKISGGKYGLSDGTPTVPFAEAYDIQFNYSKDWQSSYIGDSKGNIFEFYFEAGVEYTMYLECSLGSLKDLIQRAEVSLTVINDSYLRILQLTGSTPDEYRDYSFYTIMPDVLRNLLIQAKELMNIKKGFEELCGTNGSHIATLETIAILLDTMGSNEGDNIAANMSTLKSNLGTLGTWINNSKQGAMTLDSIRIHPSDSKDEDLPEAEAGFFASLWFEITSFIYSFFTDYDAMGLTVVPDENAPAVNVWLATGRDQSQIWRTMLDSKGGFTDMTGNAVTLRLVTAGTLLPSILAGKGPDIYMGLGAGDVINYAIRDAVVGVSGNVKNESGVADPNSEFNKVFNNYYYTYKYGDGNYETTTEYKGEENLSYVSQTFADNIAQNYVPAAMDTLTLLEVSYGIPQQMSFAMMFYRMDVLAEVGQEVPETWDDLLSLLPILQSNNMEIGVDYISALDFMIYQRGGNMWQYTDIPEYAGSKIALDSDLALETFDFTCRLYSDYSFPIAYDASNRFRTGEMPIIIGGYSGIYNTLVVYATEIEGLWRFCPLPGSKLADGTINYDSLAGVTATVMLHGCSDTLTAWQFMQWQTSAEVQANYGNSMVALLGPSAKYDAANINAIKNLSWTADEREAIEDQMAHMSSIVNYPGSYIISRYMKFAFLDAVNAGADPVDALTSYIDAINAEITRKREEFGLPTLGTDEEPPAEYFEKYK